MKNPVSVYAESTPNPSTMKFVTNKNLVPGGGMVEYNSAEEAEKAPIAARLFSFPFVEGVFLSGNFITVTKNDLVEWQDVFAELREYITNYLITGHPILEESVEVEKKSSEEKGESAQAPFIQESHKIPENELEEKIVEILEDYVRPAVESDGGAIHFRKFEEGKLSVALKGSCSGCPSSTMTLKNGIEGIFQQMMPEVKEVVALEE